MRFRYGEIELTLTEAEVKAADLPVKEEKEPERERENSGEREKVLKLIAISPHAAILQMRLKLHNAMIERARPYAKAGLVGINTSHAVEVLIGMGLVDLKTAEIIHDLLKVGNVAAHPGLEDSVSAEQAIRYMELMERVMPALKADNDLFGIE